MQSDRFISYSYIPQGVQTVSDNQSNLSSNSISDPGLPGIESASMGPSSNQPIILNSVPCMPDFYMNTPYVPDSNMNTSYVPDSHMNISYVPDSHMNISYVPDSYMNTNSLYNNNSYISNNDYDYSIMTTTSGDAGYSSTGHSGLPEELELQDHLPLELVDVEKYVFQNMLDEQHFDISNIDFDATNLDDYDIYPAFDLGNNNSNSISNGERTPSQPRVSLATMTDAQRIRHNRQQTNKSSRTHRMRKRKYEIETEAELHRQQERNNRLKEMYQNFKQMRNDAQLLKNSMNLF